MRVYLDSPPVIYTVEGVPHLSDSVDAQLTAPNTIPVASDLTWMECRVKPLREGNVQVLQDFEDYFEDMVAEVVELSHEIMDRATDIRARYGFKTPDAIHLAAAVMSGCDVFLTSDRRLSRFPEIVVITIEA